MTEPRTDAEIQASAAQDKANAEWVRLSQAVADTKRDILIAEASIHLANERREDAEIAHHNAQARLWAFERGNA